jgi:lipopolysaccharide export system ATP-binding protein
MVASRQLRGKRRMHHSLVAESLTKAYRKRTVVDGVTIEVEAGEVVGLLGPNGAGKTTTFSMIVGITRPDSGRISLDGKEITELPMYRRARRGISYLPQETSVFRKLSVEENIDIVLEALSINGEERRRLRKTYLEELGIDHLAKSKASLLSGGERRRVEICRARVMNPFFMLLDEPFAGIDPIAVADIQGIIAGLKSEGIGILVTDHNVRETLGICDKAYILDKGVVLEVGDKETIASSKRAREIYLGEQFAL